jgi:hypothetical protein
LQIIIFWNTKIFKGSRTPKAVFLTDAAMPANDRLTQANFTDVTNRKHRPFVGTIRVFQAGFRLLQTAGTYAEQVEATQQEVLSD